MPQDPSADGADLQTLVAAEALEMEIHPLSFVISSASSGSYWPHIV